MTLEEHLSQIATLLEAHRATNWALGDKFAECVKDFGKGCIGSLATLAHCSAEHIRQTIRVAVAYPGLPGVRLPDVDWSVYRETLMAAKRGKLDPMAVLATALDQDMSQAEIRWLYRDPNEQPVVLRFAKTCPHCGLRMILYYKPDDEWPLGTLACPRCDESLGKVE
jgi:ribosomal protein S27AE